MPDYPGRVQLIKPKVTLNLGFTFYGLLALGVPTRTLRGMPDEFIDGMEARAALLGDDPFLDRRDAVWRDSRGDKRVHILVTLYAQMNDGRHAVSELDSVTDGSSSAVQPVRRRRRAARRRRARQRALAGPFGGAARRATAAWAPTNKEHFGLSDGFGDPVFSGQFSGEAERLRVAGGGKLLPDQSWAPLATGEFLLGYPDEAQEIAGAAMPIDVQPQRHLHGLSQAARGCRRLPRLHRRAGEALCAHVRRCRTARRWTRSRPRWSAAGTTACR